MNARRNVSLRSSLGLALLLSASACSHHSEAGVHVELMAERSLPGGELLTAGSGRLQLEDVRWTSTEIELLGCPSALRAIQRWLVPEAHAHGESTSTLSATPVVVRGVGTDLLEPVPRIGNLEPPAGRYCSLRYQIGPADGDALGLTVVPQMLAKSFWVRGAAGPATGELTQFEFFSERTIDITLPIELELSADRPEVSLSFFVDLERWLANLDASALVGSNGAGALVDAFQGALSVRLE